MYETIIGVSAMLGVLCIYTFWLYTDRRDTLEKVVQIYTTIGFMKDRISENRADIDKHERAEAEKEMQQIKAAADKRMAELRAVRGPVKRCASCRLWMPESYGVDNSDEGFFVEGACLVHDIITREDTYCGKHEDVNSGEAAP